MQEKYKEDILIEDLQGHNSTISQRQKHEINFDKPDQELEDTPPCPNLHLIKSAICFFLFPLAGLIALFLSWEVYNKYKNGDYEGALKTSKTVNWIDIIVIGFFAGGILITVMIFFLLFFL